MSDRSIWINIRKVIMEANGDRTAQVFRSSAHSLRGAVCLHNDFDREELDHALDLNADGWFESENGKRITYLSPCGRSYSYTITHKRKV